MVNQVNENLLPNENLRSILVDAYVYRDMRENVTNLTSQLERLIRNNFVSVNDLRFQFLYNNRNNVHVFYNYLNINELQYLGF